MEHEFMELMADALEAYINGDEPFADPVHRTFEEAGLLTGDKGLVIRIGSDEFQVTVRKAS